MSINALRAEILQAEIINKHTLKATGVEGDGSDIVTIDGRALLDDIIQ